MPCGLRPEGGVNPSTNDANEAPMAADYSKILLDESEMPTQWYNVIPDLPTPPPLSRPMRLRL